MKVDILAFGAHPDDIELGCSGTIAKAIAEGKTVAMVDLTLGELGTRGNPDLRRKEALDAAEILGVKDRVALDMGDGFFDVNKENLGAVIREVRKFRPKIVLANAVYDRHPDHRIGSELVSRACFLAGLNKIETSVNGEIQASWRPELILYYVQDYYLEPDVIVDITGHWETKFKSIMAFSSQFYDPNSEEPETPISTAHFLEYLKGRALDYGRLIKREYGEGFKMKRPPGVNQVFDLV
ncbi:MAG TPA: bacillithiol biosynthesis deacetylase BshB1 [Flavobacteriales bacterium]|jgi:bacillithiol biosynthesis deacetylase BshB1|nr:bacillithiol biosynthesis deacetylase BshB1 [Flavobacteriales bacterium]